MDIIESLTNLNISEECFQDIISLIEGEIIDFQKVRMDKVMNNNAEKLAGMIRNGELKAIRVLSNGKLIGEPSAIKKMKQLEQSNNEVTNKWLKYKKNIEGMKAARGN